jgi:hypothetical protein
MTIIDTLNDPELFAPWFIGPSWDHWRAVLKAAFALPMSDLELEFFRTVAERDPPAKPVKELWIVAGRRAGKDSIASVITAHTAATFERGDRLRPGERAKVLCLAVDRDQSQIVLGYTRAYFNEIPMLEGVVSRSTATGFELQNAVDISVATNSYRSVRGHTILAGILDEVAFWRDDNSYSPDFEVYKALKPGLATLPDSLLIGISTPYRKSGLLYSKFKEHYAKSSDDVLVVVAPTRALNPTISQEIIDAALEEDGPAARAEWLAMFRDDLEDFISRDAVLACVESGVRERPWQEGRNYFAFVDPSGGSADSMTCAIGHRQGSTIVVDAQREIAAPFDPESVVDEFAKLFLRYRVRKTTGDRYAAEWCAQAFEKRGIQYRQCDLPKSGLYLNLLPHLNGKTIRLLDNQRTINQIAALERKTARGGKDSVDHPPRGRDDAANAVAGLAFIASPKHDQKPASMTHYHRVVQKPKGPHKWDGPLPGGGYATARQ